jgi:hypothetical protein
MAMLGGLLSGAASQAANARPVITGTVAPTVKASHRWVFQPRASDPEGNSLTFAASGLPDWAHFNASTGRVSGTPTSEHVGRSYSIRITVSDGERTRTLPRFRITVVARTAPTIGGMPTTSVEVGHPYSFSPTARDPQGRPLTFSIRNKPVWANFDAATGRLHGTPTAVHEGKYRYIKITADNGRDSNWLPTFTLTVLPGPPSSATVSWSPPNTNVDGSPLLNLAGYRIVYGRSASDLSETVTIPTPEITSATIEALTPGTWHFAVVAYTSSDVESDLSQIAQKSVD